ncbi:conserved phage C-terminal domain-containing protein [Salinivibrio kushneri]|uniref:conserved phage C-terminal domain-containing protein n=1 Tax=Salinivibrio kushneri TaxID=1908198 RepID=UPI0009893A96|nr:conserved phage C-terminal domain-containing protein [Salinivibrio kushneri]OOE71716.1 hypothetical protein BZG19_02045 [Salinivibrio kushneri]
MSIVRAKRNQRFTVIDNTVYADNQLSFQAMGLLSYLLSKPDHWKVSVEQLVKVTDGTEKKTGKEGVYNILRELKKSGFVVTKKHASGKMTYTVYDTPSDAANSPDAANPDQAKTEKEKPDTANPNQAKPNQAEPTLVSTDTKQVLRSSKVKSASPSDDSLIERESEVKQVIEHLNQRTHSKFQNCQSNAKHISGRLSDGHSVEDLMLVIDHKTEEWGHDAKMAQYLRPSTLFRPSKFDGYLNLARLSQSGMARPTQSGAFVPDNTDTSWIRNLDAIGSDY